MVNVEVFEKHKGMESVRFSLPRDDFESIYDEKATYVSDSCIGDMFFNAGYDAKELNDALKEINKNNDEMTTELLESIITEMEDDFDDKELIEKIISNDYMFEKLNVMRDTLTYSLSECCAMHLVKISRIPFAKDVTEMDLDDILLADEDEVFWDVIWRHYYHMGFRLICTYEDDDGSCYIVNFCKSEV